MSVLRHQVAELETQGWREVSEDHENPSGALDVMGEIPVLMQKDEET